MLKQLFNTSKYSFGLKDMKKAFYQFLNLQAGAVYRGAPQFKQRKYQNIQIAQQFKIIQKKRKQQRLMYAQKRKLLLQSKLSNQSKLLTQYQIKQLEKLNQQIKSLKLLIKQQNQQLVELDKKLQQTQAQYILVQGANKLIVLNQIIYLRHMNTHPSGMKLTPESVKIIENVHYLVTHNLPVQRYKLFEIMPSLFTKEIGQLQQSVKKLIQQKNLNMFQQNTSYSIRQFTRNLKIRDPRQYENANQLMTKHLPLIQDILAGKTVFRNFRHCYTVLLSKKFNLKLTPQEQAMKKDIKQIMDSLDKWKSYAQQNQQRIIQLKFSYIQPLPFIKNHPKLLQAYDKYMQKYTNPIDIRDSPNYFPKTQPNDDGRAFMQQRIRKQIQSIDEKFQKLFNQDRQQLITKKKQYQIQFYKISTKILQEYQALQDKSKSQQEFKKLPKKQKKKQQNYIRMTMDQIVKAIYLNNQDKNKYNLQFFAKYFGMQQNKTDLFQTLNSISFLRVFAPDQNTQGKKQVTQEVLKFMV